MFNVYFDVVVQVSDDPKFEKDVTTIFNADSQNELGLGAGKDLAYIESYEGKLIDAKGVKGEMDGTIDIPREAKTSTTSTVEDKRNNFGQSPHLGNCEPSDDYIAQST